MPSLRQIRYFLSVADLGGFTPAAAALFVAQPALSRQIAQLEEELGFPLFIREPRGVRLTEAGALFRQRVGVPHQPGASAARRWRCAPWPARRRFRHRAAPQGARLHTALLNRPRHSPVGGVRTSNGLLRNFPAITRI